MKKAGLMARGGSHGGSCNDPQRKPFCGTFNARKKCSTMRRGYRGVALTLQGGGALFFIRQIFLQGIVLVPACPAILQLVIKRDQVRLRYGKGRQRCVAWGKRDGQIGIVNGDGQREGRENGNEMRGCLLRRVDGAFLGLNSSQSDGELLVALTFAIVGLLDRGVLRGQRRRQLLRVMAR